jgi:hypothetical protein
MPTNMGGGQLVKSVQRGTVALTSAQVDVSISAVNTNNVELVMTYTMGSNSFAYIPKGKVLNGTTLRFDTDANSSGATVVQWEITEYYNLKSRQSGTLTSTSPTGTDNIGITAVNTSKSKCIATFRFIGPTGGGSVGLDGIRAALTSATNLQVTTANIGSNVIIEWQVLEFF